MNQFITSACCVSLALVAVLCRTVIGVPVHANKGYPRYAFNYAVHDLMTKDHQAHLERRDDDVVKSSYSLMEPGGDARIVDGRSGFNAIIKRIDSNSHPIPLLPAVPNTYYVNSNGIEQVSLISPLENLALLNSLTDFNYFGAAMTENPGKSGTVGLIPAPTLIGLPKTITFGKWSHVPSGVSETASGDKWSVPWDPTTGSYGGWVPMRRSNIVKHHPETYATVISKKTVNGKLHKVIAGPIPISGRMLLIKNKIYHE